MTYQPSSLLGDGANMPQYWSSPRRGPTGKRGSGSLSADTVVRFQQSTYNRKMKASRLVTSDDLSIRGSEPEGVPFGVPCPAANSSCGELPAISVLGSETMRARRLSIWLSSPRSVGSGTAAPVTGTN